VFTVRCEPNILTTNQFNFHLSRFNALNMGKFLIFIYGALDGPLFIIEQGLFLLNKLTFKVRLSSAYFGVSPSKSLL
jgi:hypothetical protein